MKLLRIILSDLCRALLSRSFFFSVLGVFLLYVTITFGQMNIGNVSVSYLLRVGMGGSGSASMILSILPIFPFAVSFASEWEERAVGYSIIRVGIHKYAISKIVVSAISGFCVVLVGMLLFTVVMLFRFPFENNTSSDVMYDIQAVQGNSILGLTMFIIHFAFSGAITSSCAIWVSTYLSNRFVAAASPIIVHFTLVRLVDIGAFPYELMFLHPINWIEGLYMTPSPAQSLLIKGLTTLCLCFFMYLASVRQIRRKFFHA